MAFLHNEGALNSAEPCGWRSSEVATSQTNRRRGFINKCVAILKLHKNIWEHGRGRDDGWLWRVRSISQWEHSETFYGVYFGEQSIHLPLKTDILGGICRLRFTLPREGHAVPVHKEGLLATVDSGKGLPCWGCWHMATWGLGLTEDAWGIWLLPLVTTDSFPAYTSNTEQTQAPFYHRCNFLFPILFFFFNLLYKASINFATRKTSYDENLNRSPDGNDLQTV